MNHKYTENKLLDNLLFAAVFDNHWISFINGKEILWYYASTSGRPVSRRDEANQVAYLFLDPLFRQFHCKESLYTTRLAGRLTALQKAKIARMQGGQNDQD